VFATLECLTDRKRDDRGDAWRKRSYQQGRKDFSEWYNQLVAEGAIGGLCAGTRLHDCASLRLGTVGNIQAGLDKRFKATGHQNVAFPLLTPRASSRKRSTTVEGLFAVSFPS